MEVFHIDQLPHRQLISSKTGETFSKSLVLTEFLSFRDLFVHHEILAPGKRASSPHSHSTIEEMVFVLEGFPTAHLGDRSKQLKPGDFVGFHPGSQHVHYIENRTDSEVRFLVICSNQDKDELPL